jgi:hypothetical protein
MIVPPDGKKPVGYSRATTIAGTLGSAWGIAPWKASMTVQGVMTRPGLRAQWEALMAETGGNPWYYDDRSKETCKKLVEECSAVGGANDRRDIGSSLHSITALIDRGQPPHKLNLTRETERDIQAYVAGLEAAGIALIPEAVELIVVLDQWRVAGMFDRLVLVDSPDWPVAAIADLKTGGHLDWQQIAVQMAIYSRADAIYRQGVAANGSQDERFPMPAVDQQRGLIFWLDAGGAQLEVHVVDLEAGWEAFKKSMWVRDWRNRKVSQPFKPTPLEVALAESLPPPPKVSDDHPHRVWLQNRVNVIGRHERARAELTATWPAGVATLKRSDTHSAADIAAIEAVLNEVEKHWEIPFPPPPPAMGQLLHLFPGSTVEGEAQ